MRMSYEEFYRKITHRFGEKEKKALVMVNRYLTYFFYFSYPVMLVYVFFFQREDFLKILLVPAISFLLVSVFRRIYDRKRPYEEHDIHPIIIKNTKGKSMPSRHVFSSTIISMCFFCINAYFGIILLLLTILSACVRVIGGVHYPGDVIAGFLTGMVCSIFLFF